MKTTISVACAGLAIILALPMTASANDGNCGPTRQKQSLSHRSRQAVEEPTASTGGRPAFENQQRLLQENQLDADEYQSQDDHYRMRGKRNPYRYSEYQGDRQEGRRRRWNQRRYREYREYRSDWR